MQDIVQSNLTKDLLAQVLRDDKIEAAKKLVAKQMAFRIAARTGQLSPEQFLMMSPPMRRQYVKIFGAPATSADRERAQAVLDKKRQQAKASKKSKVKNRRRAK